MASSIDLSAELTTTRNRTNHARLCRLILEGGTKTLRELFGEIIPPPTLASCLSQPEIKQTLQDLRFNRNKRPAVIRNNEWNILYPTPLDSVSSANFDITLLMILFKNICQLKQPRSGWDSHPSSKDQSKEADIVRIKLSRNELAHGSSTNISDWHFEQKWKEISDALVRRGADRRDIDRLKTESMDSELEERYCNEILETGNVNADNIEVLRAILDKITDPVSRCERHDRNVDNYCETCKMLICEECESGDDHKYHRVVLLKVAAHSLLGELQSGDKELQRRGGKVAMSIKNAIHCSKKLEKQLTDRKESLLKSKSEENDPKFDECLDRLTSQYDEIQTNIKSELEILHQTEKDIRQAIRLIKDLFMKENDVQFLFHGKGAISTVNTALSKPFHFESTKHDILYLPDFTEGVELVFPALPSNSTMECENEDKLKHIGERVWFAVYTRNYAGKSVRNCTDELNVVLEDPRSNKINLKVVKSFEGSVTHHITFVPWKKGKHKLSVTLSDHEITNSPFTFVVPQAPTFSDTFNGIFFISAIGVLISSEYVISHKYWPVFLFNRYHYFLATPYIWFSKSLCEWSSDSITNQFHWTIECFRTWFAYTDFNIYVDSLKRAFY